MGINFYVTEYAVINFFFHPLNNLWITSVIDERNK